MRKLCILIIIAYFGWEYYVDNYNGTPATETLQTNMISPLKSRFDNRQKQRFPSDEPLFECDGRQYCEQMTSYAEAVYFSKNCPNTDMDGDYDGVPCEGDPRFLLNSYQN